MITFLNIAYGIKKSTKRLMDLPCLKSGKNTKKMITYNT